MPWAHDWEGWWRGQRDSGAAAAAPETATFHPVGLPLVLMNATRIDAECVHPREVEFKCESSLTRTVEPRSAQNRAAAAAIDAEDLESLIRPGQSRLSKS
jgi:hypothetical protein